MPPTSFGAVLIRLCSEAQGDTRNAHASNASLTACPADATTDHAGTSAAFLVRRSACLQRRWQLRTPDGLFGPTSGVCYVVAIVINAGEIEPGAMVMNDVAVYERVNSITYIG